MAIKKLRFPLEMENGAEVRTIEELRENFSMEKVLMYFSDGKLIKWLRNNYLDEEAEAVSELDPKDPDLNRKLCDIFDVEYNESAKVNIEEITANKQRLTRLKEYTSDEKLADVIDIIAFDQNELDGLLSEGAKEVYLCGSWFRIPLNRENVRYIGINQPIAEINSLEEVDFKAMNISFQNIKFDEEYSKIVEKKKFDADFSGSADNWTEPRIKQCKRCIELNDNNVEKIYEKFKADGYVHYSLVLLDYRHDYYHEKNEYTYSISIGSGMCDLRNLITIIADNTSYMKKYMELSKSKINLLKMKHCEYDGYRTNLPKELLRYSGLVLINNLKTQEETEMHLLGRSSITYKEETEMHLLGIRSSKTYNEYSQIHYSDADVIGVWVPEKLNKRILSYAINKEVRVKFKDYCEYQGYILPFDIMRDILSDKDTILISEKSQGGMYLFRDSVTYSPWVARYSSDGFSEKNQIYKACTKDDSFCFENEYVPVDNVSRIRPCSDKE
ncbi:MAG: hypothetical protein ACI4YB_12660 [Oscillospiraceae bacterium]